MNELNYFRQGTDIHFLFGLVSISYEIWSLTESNPTASACHVDVWSRIWICGPGRQAIFVSHSSESSSRRIILSSPKTTPSRKFSFHCFLSLKLMATSCYVGTTKEQAASSNDNDPFICILPLPFSPILCVLQSFWRRRSCSSFNQNQHKTCERGKRILRFTGKPERCAVLDALHLLVPTKTY